MPTCLQIYQGVEQPVEKKCREIYNAGKLGRLYKLKRSVDESLNESSTEGHESEPDSDVGALIQVCAQSANQFFQDMKKQGSSLKRVKMCQEEWIWITIGSQSSKWPAAFKHL